MGDWMNEKVLGSDIACVIDFDMGVAGEGKLVTGRACLSQDLIHAVTTPKGSLLWHPSYGIDVYKYIKMGDSVVNRLQLEQEVRRTIQADPRVVFGSVVVTAESWGTDKIRVKAQCTPIEEEHPLNLIFGFGAFDSKGEVVDA